MVDIHSHVLRGMDDGASTMEESLALLEIAREGGTTDIVATPHCNPQYAYQPELVERAVAELNVRAGGTPKVHRGCEFHLTFDNIDLLMNQPSAYTINGRQYLLIECPDSHVGKYTEPVLERLLERGLIPIVTHPERNPVLQGKIDRVAAWVELGCLTQVTALSIMGAFGGAAKTASAQLLDRGLAHAVASDAHNPKGRHSSLREAYAAVRARYGDAAAELLFEVNPRRIVEGVPVPSGRQPYGRPPGLWRRLSSWRPASGRLL
jgi:protein-tyrosine phosphatase